MKLSIITSLALLQCALGFAPVTSPKASFGLTSSCATPPSTSSTVIFSEPNDEEEEGLDLNLEEMFDMFDAADKGEEFDDAIDKVKGN